MKTAIKPFLLLTIITLCLFPLHSHSQVDTFPWTEGFEGSFLPDGWSKIVHDGNDITQYLIDERPSGAFSARFSSINGSNNYNQYLFSPPITIDSSYTTLSFWHKKSNSQPEILEWGIATTTDTNDYTWTSVILSDVYWQQIYVDLDAYVGNTVYIAWHYYGDNYAHVYLDDIEIDVTLPCFPPSNISANNNTNSGADLAWTDYSGNSHWDLYITPYGSTAPMHETTPTINDTQDTTVTWIGGVPGIYYDLYIRSDCGQNDSIVSPWTEPYRFYTTCNNTTAEMPYYEDFDNIPTDSLPAMPGCMLVENTNNDQRVWETSTFNPLSSPNCVTIVYNDSLDMDDWFFTQGLDLIAGTTYEVSFSFRARFSFYPEKLKVHWGSDAVSDSMSPTPIFDNNSIINTSWETAVITFAPPSTSTYYIGFHGYSEVDMHTLYVDDIEIDIAPCDSVPTNLTATAITDSGAVLGWTDGSGSNWDLYITLHGNPAPIHETTPTIDDITSNPYTWNGGEAGKYYDFYVRRDCYGNDQHAGNWAGPVTFNTTCNNISTNVPYYEDFDNIPTDSLPAMPGCMLVEDANNDHKVWETSNLHSRSSPVSARIVVNTSEYMNDWFFTRGLDLIAGITYEVSFVYRGNGANHWTEKFVVDWGPGPASDSMSGTPIYDDDNIKDFWRSKNVTITPSSTGTYYVGFHGYRNSDFDQYQLFVDNIEIDILPCDAPTNLTATAITDSGADLGWTDGSGSNWDLYITLHGNPAPVHETTPTIDDTTSNPYTWNGGEAGKFYDFYVRSDCYGRNQYAGPWTEPVTFSTTCNNVSTNVLPYIENFDDITTSPPPAMPGCISVEDANDDDEVWKTSNLLLIFKSSPVSARIKYNADTGMNDWFFTRGLDLIAGVTYEVSFAYKAWSGHTEKLKVHWGTEPASYSMSVRPIYNDSFITGSTWKSGNATITPSSTGTYYVGFHGYSDTNAFYLFVDDIEIDVLPCDTVPTNLSASNPTNSGADLAWTDNLGNHWDLYITLHGNPAPIHETTPTIDDTTSNPYTWNGGEAGSYYDFYVRSDCYGRNQVADPWTGPVTFSTTCSNISTNVPYIEDFDHIPADSLPAMPGCMAVENTNDDYKVWETTDSIFRSSPVSVTIFNSDQFPKNDWFFTRGLELFAGATYEVSFAYRGMDNFTEKLKVHWGSGAVSDSMSPTPIFDDDQIYTSGDTWLTGSGEFTPTSTGTHYVGFHGYSDANMHSLFVDDIEIDIVPCNVPTDLTATAVTDSGAVLGWTDGSGSNWDLYITLHGNPAPIQETTPTIDDTTSNPYTWNGGKAGSYYDFYVRRDCYGRNQVAGPWTGPVTFNTTCNYISTNVPYYEDFDHIPADSIPAMPGCMLVENTDVDGHEWMTTNSVSNSSPNCAKIKQNTGGVDGDWFFTQGLDLIADSTYKVSFAYRANNSSYSEQLKVHFGTAAVSGSMPDPPIYSNNSITNTTWFTDSTIFKPSTTVTYYVGFHAYCDPNSTDELFIDDIEIEAIPTCITPTNLSASNPTNSGADLAWIDNSGTHWDLYITLHGNPAPVYGIAPTIVDTQSNPTTWTGGNSGKYYDLYVRSYCGENNLHVSNWEGPFTFGTTCNNISTNVPYYEDFDHIPTDSLPAMPGCISVEDANNDEKVWETSNDFSRSSPVSARIVYNDSLDMDDWFFTQGLDLIAGTTYKVSFAYKGMGSLWPEKLKVHWGSYAVSDLMPLTPIYADDNVGSAWRSGNATITPTSTGTYYVGFHGYSDKNQHYLFVDDIEIDIVPCDDVPTNLITSNPTNSGAKLGWTDGSGSHWDLYITFHGNPAPIHETTPTIDDITSNPYTWYGGEAGKCYNFYVRRDCYEYDQHAGPWTGPVTFSTTCNNVSTNVLPYIENFDHIPADSLPAMPGCMLVENTNNDVRVWETSNSLFKSSPVSARIMYSTGEDMDDWFFTRGLELLAGATYEVSFAYRGMGESWLEKLKVHWGSYAASDSMPLTPIFDDNNIGSSWKSGNATITPSSTGTYYVGFNGYSDADMHSLFVDDIEIDIVPCDSVPTNLTATDVTGSGADLGWTDGSGSNWDLYITLHGNPAPIHETTPTIDDTTSNPYTWDGGEAGKYYDFYVRRDCYGRNQYAGTWAGPFTFVTTCNNISTVPYYENFDHIPTDSIPAMPGCISVENKNIDDRTWKTTNSVSLSSPVSVTIFNSDQFPKNDWFFTQGLELFAGATYEVSFAYRGMGATWPEKLKVHRGSYAASDSMSLTPIFDDNNIGSSSWKSGNAIITPSSTGTYYVGFHGYSDINKHNLFVDDIEIDVVPCNAVPIYLTATAVTDLGADLGWADGSGSNWDLYITLHGNPAPVHETTPTIDDTTSNPYTWNGGKAGKYYDFYVRSDCYGRNQYAGTWAGPVTFNTTCNNISTVPYYENFDHIPTDSLPAMPGCMLVENTNNDDREWGTTNYLFLSSPPNRRHVHIGGHLSGGINMNDWFFTQGLELVEGTTYEISFTYSGIHDYNREKLAVHWGTGPASDSMSDTTIFDDNNIGRGWKSGNATITPSSTDTYYVGFRSYSDNSKYYLYVDDIEIDVLPCDAVPTNLSTSDPTNSGADLEWTDNSGSNWDLYITLHGNPAPVQETTPTIDDATSNPYTWNGGEAGKYYDFYVRRDCYGRNLHAGTWAGPVTFNTTCNYINISTDVPYYENFDHIPADSIPAMPGCMLVENTDGDGHKWMTTNSVSNSSPNCAKIIQSTGGVDGDWFFTQGLDLIADTTYKVSFAYRANNSSISEQLKVHFGTAAVSNSMPDPPIYSNNSITNTTWITDSTIFKPSTTGTCYVGFHAYCDPNSTDELFIDDIEIEAIPSCITPSNLSASNPTNSGADLAWTDNSGTHWDLYITLHDNPAPIHGTTPTIDDTTSNPYTWDGGEAGKYYDFYVRSSYCGENNLHVSTWTEPITFVTTCNNISTNVPYIENFDNIPTPAMPGCMLVENTNNDDREWETTSLFLSPNCVYIEHNYNEDMNDWFFTQGLDLIFGTHYKVTFNYQGGGIDLGEYSYDKLKVHWGSGAVSDSMSSTPIFDDDSIATNVDTQLTGSGEFTPTSTGTYYVGFHGYSDKRSLFLSVDDIEVDILPCTAPTNLTATDVTNSGADLGWTDGLGSNWDLYITLHGNPAPIHETTPTIDDATSNPYTWDGGEAGKFYDFYVRSDCYEYDQHAGLWTGPVTFNTTCNNVSTNVLPYIENFDHIPTDSLPTMPGCMAVENTNDDYKVWETTDSIFRSSPVSVTILNSNQNPKNDWFFTQGLDLIAGTTYEVSFVYRGTSTQWPEKLAVDWGSDQVSDSMSGTPIFDDDSISTDYNTWLSGSGEFTPSSTGTYYVGFHGYSDANKGDICVDDIEVDIVPCNAVPTNLTATAVTDSGAVLGWTDGSGNNWDLYITLYGNPAPVHETTPTIDDATSHPHTWNGGEAGKYYDFYVRSDCYGRNQHAGNWAGPVTFSTTCNDISTIVPYYEDFDNIPATSLPAMPGCISVEDANTDEIVWETSNYLSQSSPNSARIMFSTGEDRDDWFFTQGLELLAGATYEVSFVYSYEQVPDSTIEKLAVDWGTWPASDSMSGTLIFNNDNISDLPPHWRNGSGEFTPSSTGIYYVGFHGYSGANNMGDLFVDVIEIDILPCTAPTNLIASNISTTGAKLDWIAEPGAYYDLYITEYGNPAPDSATTPTINNIQDSTYTWTGGTEGTYYDVYVRRDCSENNFHVSTWAGPTTFKTRCSITNVPYIEDFDNDTTTPDLMPACMAVENTNGDGITWKTTIYHFQSSPKSVRISYNTKKDMNDWFFTQGLDLIAGTTYEVSFAYRGMDWTEKLKVHWGSYAVSDSMLPTPIFDNNSIINTSWETAVITFAPPSTGTYYVGFHGYSDANNSILYVDDIKIIPVVVATIWEGTVDSDWDNPANWSNGLPSSTTVVTISANRMYDPVIEKSSIIGNLIID